MAEKLIKETEIEKSETVETPKEPTKQEKLASKYAKYKDVAENKLRSNKKFGKEASEDLNDALYDLGSGSNPTAKFLEQKFEMSPNADEYAKILNTLSPTEDFIGSGQGAEYGLVNGLAVNKLDYTKFIPVERNDLGNYTEWDNITLSADPDDYDKVELSIAPYLYLPYYLSGKIDELASMLSGKLDEAMIRKQSKALLDLIHTLFVQTHAKTSSTTASPTNRLVGDTTLSQVDAMKEFLDFEFNMKFDNVQFNYGSDTLQSGVLVHSDFTASYNSLPDQYKVYVCEYQTYNNMKKYATTFLSQAEIKEYFKMDKWIVLPTSIYNNATASPSTKGSISSVVTLSDTNGRVAGAVMVLDKRALKRCYNYLSKSSEHYPANDTTQLFLMKNWAMKYLKWGQTLVYENSALESSFVVPTVTQD